LLCCHKTNNTLDGQIGRATQKSSGSEGEGRERDLLELGVAHSVQVTHKVVALHSQQAAVSTRLLKCGQTGLKRKEG